MLFRTLILFFAMSFSSFAENGPIVADPLPTLTPRFVLWTATIGLVLGVATSVYTTEPLAGAMVGLGTSAGTLVSGAQQHIRDKKLVQGLREALEKMPELLDRLPADVPAVHDPKKPLTEKLSELSAWSQTEVGKRKLSEFTQNEDGKRWKFRYANLFDEVKDKLKGPARLRNRLPSGVVGGREEMKALFEHCSIVSAAVLGTTGAAALSLCIPAILSTKIL